MMVILLAALIATVKPVPHTFDSMPDRASDVIELRLGAVGKPSPEGRCWVGGEVTGVKRGPHYRRGEQITLAVPCGRASVDPVGDAPFRLDAEWLRRVTKATVGVDSDGDVVRFEATNGLQLVG